MTLRWWAERSAGIMAFWSVVGCGSSEMPPQDAQSAATPTAETQIDERFREVNNDHSPGCAVVVAKRGQIVFRKGYGMANVAEHRPMTPATVSQVASIAKQFTAHAVMLLAAQQKVSLDDPLKKHLTAFANSPLGDIRLRQLMFHTSGIRDYYDLHFLQGADVETETTTQAHAFDLLSRQKTTSWKPGTEFGYSNSNYLLLAEVVAHASTMSFSAFTEQHLFAPRKMAHSQFRTSEDLKKLPAQKGIFADKAEAYTKDKSGNWKEATPAVDSFGATGMYASADDLILWATSFDGAPAGDGASAHRTVRGALDDGTPVDYGYGLVFQTYRGREIVRHAGGHGPYRALLTSLPTEETHAAITCNARVVDFGALAETVMDLFMMHGCGAKAPIPTPNLTDLKTRAGLYFSPKIDEFWEVVATENGLADPLRGPFKPESDGAFLAGLSNVVRFTGQGTSTKLVQTDRNAPKMAAVVFDQVSPNPPTAAERAAFVGKYESAELGVTLEIAEKDNTLIANLPKRNLPLSPLATDVLQSPDLGVIRFSRDGSGNVTAALATLGGTARFVRFDRVGATP